MTLVSDERAPQADRLGRPLRVEHWGDALAQGEVAGRAAAGDADTRWEAMLGFWSTIGDRTVRCA